ncbi:MAG: P-loop NTPase, partial [Oscillospiraceae bacterium]|nr:P-loop NTPase [Oscillospiraceae bacterium]
MDKRKNQSEFNLSVFWHNFTRVFPRLFFLPLILALLLGGYRYYSLQKNYHPVYEMYSIYRIFASQSGSIDLNSRGHYVDTTAATNLATSFPYLIKSDSTKSYLQSKYGTGALPATVSCSAQATLLTLTSHGDSPEHTADALHMAADVFPLAGARILGSFQLELFEEGPDPVTPINIPNTTSSSIKWALLGFAIGLSLIALMAVLRKTVHNSEDLRELLNVPCLGLLPLVRFKARTKSDHSVLLTNPHLDESFAEAVRSTRFELLKELEQHPLKVLMVNSTSPNEGKSTISANLALALSEQGHRVILIDCDLRKQSLKELFGIKESTRGLVELIASDDSDVESALVKVKGSELRLLCGDKLAQQPLNFLASPRLQVLI